MAATKEEIKELAEHIYDLDAEVYVHLGSSLGRVFNRDRERCVNRVTHNKTAGTFGPQRAWADREHGPHHRG